MIKRVHSMTGSRSGIITGRYGARLECLETKEISQCVSLEIRLHQRKMTKDTTFQNGAVQTRWNATGFLYATDVGHGTCLKARCGPKRDIQGVIIGSSIVIRSWEGRMKVRGRALEERKERHEVKWAYSARWVHAKTERSVLYRARAGVEALVLRYRPWQPQGTSRQYSAHMGHTWSDIAAIY